jgi:hypothetical protein
MTAGGPNPRCTMRSATACVPTLRVVTTLRHAAEELGTSSRLLMRFPPGVITVASTAKAATSVREARLLSRQARGIGVGVGVGRPGGHHWLRGR